MPYSGIRAIVLSGLEPAVSIAMACVPLLRPLWRRGHHRGEEDTRNTAYVGREQGEWNDDGSEIQLRPMNVKQSVMITSQQQQHTIASQAQQRLELITIEKAWEVRSYRQTSSQ